MVSGLKFESHIKENFVYISAAQWHCILSCLLRLYRLKLPIFPVDHSCQLFTCVWSTLMAQCLITQISKCQFSRQDAPQRYRLKLIRSTSVQPWQKGLKGLLKIHLIHIHSKYTRTYKCVCERGCAVMVFMCVRVCLLHVCRCTEYKKIYTVIKKKKKLPSWCQDFVLIEKWPN